MRDKKLIQMYITNMCNSHCKTCSIWKNKERQELRPGDIGMITTLFPNADYVIGGGEAILHTDIDKILMQLHEDKINYTLLSNCILNQRLYDLIQKYEVPAVTISFDGLRHDDIRGVTGNAKNIWYFKEWCDFNSVRMKISYTYSKYNEDCFEEDMKYIKERLGFNEIYFCIAQDMDLLMTAEADGSFVAGNFEKILKCDLVSEKDKKHIRGMVTGVRRCCTSQNNVHTIYSNGDIVRCQSFKSREVLGNLYKMSTYEVMQLLESVENVSCPYDSECDLLCQRRYD